MNGQPEKRQNKVIIVYVMKNSRHVSLKISACLSAEACAELPNCRGAGQSEEIGRSANKAVAGI